MENRTIQELFSRKSVRVFSDEKITEEEKRLILEAAIQAPTAGNMSLFSILDIQSQEIKDVLERDVITRILLQKRLWYWCFWRIIRDGVTYWKAMK